MSRHHLVSAPLLNYMQRQFADEWANFCERTDTPVELASISLEEGQSTSVTVDKEQQLRLWCSLRGQTLARTIRGMSQYEAALLHQALLEDPSLDEKAALALVRSKCDVVVAAQVGV